MTRKEILKQLAKDDTCSVEQFRKLIRQEYHIASLFKEASKNEEFWLKRGKASKASVSKINSTMGLPSRHSRKKRKEFRVAHDLDEAFQAITKFDSMVQEIKSPTLQSLVMSALNQIGGCFRSLSTPSIPATDEERVPLLAVSNGRQKSPSASTPAYESMESRSTETVTTAK